MHSPQDLATLIAIADTGSVRAAAAAVGRTQPAVTQAIKRLEQALCFALLDRTGYRARLTERGAIFAARARVLVQQAKALENVALYLARDIEPRVRIAHHGAVAVQSWLAITRAVSQKFPETVLELEAGEGDAPVRRLLTHEAQLAVLLHQFPERERVRVESKKLGEIEFVNVVHADKLAALQRGEPLPQILVADFDDPTTRYGVVDGQRHWRVSDHRTKAALVVRGDGWGSVPRRLVRKELQRGTLVAVSHLGLANRTRRPYALFRQRDQAHGPVASFIWAQIGARATR